MYYFRISQQIQYVLSSQMYVFGYFVLLFTHTVISHYFLLLFSCLARYSVNNLFMHLCLAVSSLGREANQSLFCLACRYLNNYNSFTYIMLHTANFINKVMEIRFLTFVNINLMSEFSYHPMKRERSPERRL